MWKSRLIALLLKHRNEISEEQIALLEYYREHSEMQEDSQNRPKYLQFLQKEQLIALKARVDCSERGTPRTRVHSEFASK